MRRCANGRKGAANTVDCREWIPPIEPFHLEHIVARQHDGRTELENLAWACHRCNRHKGTNLSGIDPETGAVVVLFNPRKEAWEEHFTKLGANIVGLTKTGRATVKLLQMNAERRVDRREALRKMGYW